LVLQLTLSTAVSYIPLHSHNDKRPISANICSPTLHKDFTLKHDNVQLTLKFALPPCWWY